MKFGKHKKFVPLKGRLDPDGPLVTECLCGAVIDHSEPFAMRDHTETCPLFDHENKPESENLS